jgi:arylsulfatase A-like enzyme
VFRQPVIVALVCCLMAFAAASASAARKPNIVLIVGDDLGYADIGAQGISKDVLTPNIDSIAAAGVRFTNGYVSGPVCSPTRAGLMTGRYQQRFGFEQNPLGQSEEQQFGLPLDEVTLPQRLKQAGYATGMFGKWHLGHRAGMLPHERGFDEFFGFAGGAHRYINMVKPEEGNNALQRNGKPVGEKEHLTDAFTREAVSFIERHHTEPFFLYLPYNSVHVPQQAPQKYLERFPDAPNERRKQLLANLSQLDDGVGQVIAKLKEHKLEEDTLLVFFSDNGGPTYGNGSLNTPLRGVKGMTLEGGVRVPFMMQWPGKLPAGKVDDRMVIQLDLNATTLAAAGVPAPSGAHAADGVDLVPFFANAKQKDVIHESLYWRFGPRRAIRSGDMKLQWEGDETPHLYDLSKDVGEATDLAASRPDVAKALMTKWKEWDAQLMPPRWAGRLEGGPGAAGADDEQGGASTQRRRRPRP